MCLFFWGGATGGGGSGRHRGQVFRTTRCCHVPRKLDDDKNVNTTHWPSSRNHVLLLRARPTAFSWPTPLRSIPNLARHKVEKSLLNYGRRKLQGSDQLLQAGCQAHAHTDRAATIQKVSCATLAAATALDDPRSGLCKRLPLTNNNNLTDATLSLSPPHTPSPQMSSQPDELGGESRGFQRRGAEDSRRV